MSKRYLLRLDAIEEALRDVQRDFEHINNTLDMRREHIDDTIIENMLAGYEYCNTLLKMDVDMVSEDCKHHALEMNHVVLCGLNPRTRIEFAQHLKETATRFYSQPECNIWHIVRWNKKNKKKSVWKRAASTYIFMLSRPQLFFEGNHRTGALMMSNILALEGKPPFVLTVDNAQAYLNPSTMVKMTDKNLISKLYKLPKIEKKFASFLEDEAQKRFIKAVKD